MDETTNERAMKEAADLLNAVELHQDGKTFATPVQGAYRIAVRNRMTYWGDRDAAVKILSAAYPGCEFSWEE